MEEEGIFAAMFSKNHMLHSITTFIPFLDIENVLMKGQIRASPFHHAYIKKKKQDKFTFVIMIMHTFKMLKAFIDV